MKYDFKTKDDKLQYFAELAERSETRINFDLYKKWRNQYEGDGSIDGSCEDAKYPINVTYEMIDTIKSTEIPAPNVEPEMPSESHRRLAKMIERMLLAQRKKIGFEQINDDDETNTSVIGADFLLIEWDVNKTSHNTYGDLSVTLIDPENFLPQPGVYDIDDMEWCIVRYNITQDAVRKMYDLNEDDLAACELDPRASSEQTEEDDLVTVYRAFYYDVDKNVCEYIWSGKCELADVEDYYQRHLMRCKNCGKIKGLCECEKPAYERENLDYEELTEDVPTGDFYIDENGQRQERVIPAQSHVFKNGKMRMITELQPVTDEKGVPMMQDVEGYQIPVQQEVQVPLKRPTRLPYYKPKHFPIVIRRNISKKDSLIGQSDCETIRPYQQDLNKINSRMMEKLINASVTVAIPATAADDVEGEGNNKAIGEEVSGNSILKNYLELPAGTDYRQIGVIDTTPNIASDMNAYEFIYDKMKRALGITESMQGNPDTTAKSGIAKQQQIAQSVGRLLSRRLNKYTAYAKGDRIQFELMLAFADEPRPAAYMDEFGKIQNDAFNRYAFYAYDETSGNWYIDDRYMFTINISGDLSENKPQLWELAAGDYASGLYGQPGTLEALVLLWKDREAADYPNAKEKVAYFSAALQAQKAAIAMQNQQQMSPDQMNAAPAAPMEV